MNINIDVLYQTIAQNIVNSIEGEWTEAVINFQFFGDAGKYNGRYLTLESRTEQDFTVGYNNYKAFKQIHQIMTEDGSNKWNRAKFTLYPTGKFSIDFEWDQALADEVEANS